MGSYTKQQREHQKAEALRVWMTGASIQNIANALGIPPTTAWERLQTAIDDMRPHADYDHYRAVQLAELEVIRHKLRSQIVDHRLDHHTAYAAIDRLLKLQEREAKLLGLDRAPTPSQQLEAMTDEELEAKVIQWRTELETADSVE